MPETTSRHCNECKHSVFSVVWGEYKCTKRCTFVYHPDKEPATCKDFDPKRKADIASKEVK